MIIFAHLSRYSNLLQRHCKMWSACFEYNDIGCCQGWGAELRRLVNNELMVRVSYMNVHQILHIFATFTHLYSFPTRSKCVGEALLVGWSCCLVTGSSIAVLCTWLGELHWHSKTGTSLPLPLTFLLFQWCSLRFQDQDDQKCGGGLGGWSCCHVDSSSGAILRPCYRASGCARAGDGQENVLWQLKHSQWWAEGRMKGCGRFKRYGDWPVARHVNVTEIIWKAWRRKRWRERGRGSKGGGVIWILSYKVTLNQFKKN